MKIHQVATVPRQSLSSASYPEVIDICRREGKCLVTCDRGFGNRLKYNPLDYPGIVIIPLPSRPNFAFWQEAIETLIQGLNAAEVIGKLWIIQRGSIQKYRPIEPDI